MSEPSARRSTPRVIVLADVASNAQGIIERTLEPAGIDAWAETDPDAPRPDILVVDVTQLRGDPLASLRNYRAKGEEAPAIVLAAHFPAARLRDLFRLGVADVLLKPYKAVDLCRAVLELGEARAEEVTTQLLARRLQSTREEARRRSEEIRWLSEIGRAVVRLRNLDDILTRVVEAASFLSNAEEANIYLADSSSNEVVLRASKSAGESRGTLNRLRITDSLAGQVYRTGKPVVRQPGADASKVKVQTGFLVQSLIKVPIRIEDHVVGVLGVYNRLAPRSFSDHHLTLLSSLADWAGIALEQAAARDGPGAPAKDEPQAGPSPAAPPRTTRVASDAIRALKLLQERIVSLLKGEAADLPPPMRDELLELQADVDRLTAMPMAILDPEELTAYLDLENLAKRITEELQMAARQRELQLTCSADLNVPRIHGDRQRTHRVMEALTAASIRRTRGGKVELEIKSFYVQGGSSRDYPLPAEVELPDGLWLGVRVFDTSGGLSPDTVRALSIPKADPEVGKLGPGLSMGEIRMIAESMGGRLWHEHTSAGAAIFFALPAR